jgi:hypothetical protein
MKIKNLFRAALAGAALITVPLAAEAQAYNSDQLLATNTWITVFPTNFVAANYYVTANPNVITPNLGFFEVKPQAASLLSYLATAEGPLFQLEYAQTAYNNITNYPNSGTNGVIIATFQPVLDDYTVSEIAKGLIAYPTNNASFTVSFQLSNQATNPGQYFLASSLTVQTNTFNAKWVKLIGMTGVGFTNGLQIRSLRVGYPGPAAGPLQ